MIEYRLSPEDDELDDLDEGAELSLDDDLGDYGLDDDDEELVNDGGGDYATTEKDYGDFELLVEYKTVPRADSGIYLRGCPQVQIWDYTDTNKFARGADKGSGGLWNNSPGAPGKDPSVLADKPFGEWNSFRIRQIGAGGRPARAVSREAPSSNSIAR
jgi:hypothetical protein